MSETSWQWRRWIKAEDHQQWLDRLENFASPPWNIVERPGGSRALLLVYFSQKTKAARLLVLGGKLVRLDRRQWLRPAVDRPLQIGRRLRVVHQPSPAPKGIPQLLIPHGLAFGSGDHATTAMLLRALAGRTDWSGKRVLDLGTGTGALALAARLFGAQKIVATDIDPQAVSTARRNEELNFSSPTISWRCADVKKLGPARYDQVLANLFSNILAEAAPVIARAVAPGGELWLSGILRVQHDQVARAYRKEKLRLKRTVTRGRWEMQQWLRA